ncbi:HAD-IIB family hydrolase [Phytoactinopolyspora mesophila]|uniref:HAD-IIB family hydrolase n=1 Tax=Phytoactinopolyspora mesophila TaxID=2650750 RepID=A0A7K3M777_9ACTN|nr:HAD-IIB family hydrolase [Phytoactinopolyspora mesophila]
MPFDVPQPRVVATDLDGTLLRSDGTVSSRTREALRLAEDAGATVVFVTGRPPRWLDILADAVAGHGVTICANGALVYDVHRRVLIEQHSLDGQVAMEVALALRAALPGVTFAIERELVYGKESAFQNRWPLPDGAIEAELDVLLAEPVAKMIARHASIPAPEFVSKGVAVVGDLASTTYSESAPMLEISALGISKASTLAAFCAERGIASDEVVAFGDMPNDSLMLEWAGTSFAMENAHPDAVAAAGHRCGRNDDDGVAQVLERFFA